MSWGLIEHPHELRYVCDHDGCGFEVTASAHDPLVMEVVDEHEAAHDLPGLTARWAHSHVASPQVWEPRRGRDRWQDIAGAAGFLVVCLLVVAVFGGWW